MEQEEVVPKKKIQRSFGNEGCKSRRKNYTIVSVGNEKLRLKTELLASEEQQKERLG